MYFIKYKNRFTVEYLKLKMQGTNLGKAFAIHICDKGVVFRINKKLLRLNNKKF